MLVLCEIVQRATLFSLSFIFFVSVKMAKFSVATSPPTRSWRNASPDRYGYGGERYYGGVVIPFGGRHLKASSVHKWTKPVPLLSKQEAHGLDARNKSHMVWKQQAKRGPPKVPGCHLASRVMVRHRQMEANTKKRDGCSCWSEEDHQKVKEDLDLVKQQQPRTVADRLTAMIDSVLTP